MRKLEIEVEETEDVARKREVISSIQHRMMDFEEFCVAAISVHQPEAMDTWEKHARRAYELFEKDGNIAIMIEELASIGSDTPRGSLEFLDLLGFYMESHLIYFKRHNRHRSTFIVQVANYSVA